MKSKDIIEFRGKITDIVSKNDSHIGEEAKYIEHEYSIDSVNKLQEAICSIENEQRLLQIGIVGRVKAGKSSLLNALLFDGLNILPKAATPMTAALTQISYGDNLSAEVEFFSQKDIEEIKKGHYEYTEKLQKLIDEKTNSAKFHEKISSKEDLQNKSRKQAQRELNSNTSLSSTYDQYERMKSSGVDIQSLKDKSTLNAKDVQSLSQQLLAYVGSEGRYMPFTKSVHIKLPQDNLHGIQIVDTPGLNDPVQSREDRTRELLKYCDVIFIVSPSGQFLSKEDVELMDRITTKEGVTNLFVISSQIDNQLMGDEKEKGNGDLHQILKNITSKLGGHLSTTLTQLKKNNPEVGTTFDQLIEQGQRHVIHSSGICQTLRNQFDSKELWDSGARTVWLNLTREYPDYFSDTDKVTSIASLDKLSNLSEIKNIVATVGAKKQQILEARKENFVKVKFDSLLKYRERLLSFCKKRVRDIKSNDKERLEQEKQKLTAIINNVSVDIDNEYSDVVKSLGFNLKNELIKELESYFRKAAASVDKASDVESETYKVKKSGVFSWVAGLWGGGYENHTRTYATIRSGTVRNSLEQLTYEIERSIKDKSERAIIAWRKEELQAKVVQILRSGMGDEKLSSAAISQSIKRVINEINTPDLKYSGSIPNTLRARGILISSDAEKFIDDAESYLSKLQIRAKGDIDKYMRELINGLSKVKLSNRLLEKYMEEIRSIEILVKNKNIELDRFGRIVLELERID